MDAKTAIMGILMGGKFLGDMINNISRSGSEKEASEIQIAAMKEAIQAQKEMHQSSLDYLDKSYNQSAQSLDPYIQQGYGAVDQLQGLMKDPSSITKDPFYNTMAEEAERSLLFNASATGGLRSGATRNALGRIRPAIASNLFNQRFNQLQGLAGMGQGSASALAGARSQMGMNMADLNRSHGNNMAYGLNTQGLYQAGRALAPGVGDTINDSLGQALAMIGPYLMAGGGGGMGPQGMSPQVMNPAIMAPGGMEPGAYSMGGLVPPTA